MPANFQSLYALDTLAQTKCDEGCRAGLKEIADEVMQTRLSYEIVQSMYMARDRGYLKDDLVVTMVKVNQALLVFNRDAVEVHDMISKLVPKTKKDVLVPPKTLVKMAAIRLRDMVKVYDNVIQGIESQNKTLAEGIAGNSPWAKGRTPTPNITAPEEVRTVDMFRSEMDRLVNNSNVGRWITRDLKKKVDPFMAKPELQDEYISQGWDLVLTKMVMSE